MSFDVSSLAGVSPSQVHQQLDKADSEANLRQFIEVFWDVLEPGRVFVPNWHIDAICDHLQAVSDGEILRLLINVPPGAMKSLTTNVFWPAWEWGPQNRADKRYVCASYSDKLTIRDNRRCRNIIRSGLYQTLWGDRFQLVEDQDTKTRYDTTKTGFKIATSVGGLATGERGDRFVIDDPHNIRDGESDAKREAALHWFTEVVPTRVNDPETSSIIIIMQRVHRRDVAGVALDLGYEQLILPMEYEGENRCKTSINFSDIRTEEDQLLWPGRFTREVVDRDKDVLGSYATAAQFQQRPAPRGGGIFQKDWFEVVNHVPKDIIATVRGWDLAGSKRKRSAYTAGVKLSRDRRGNFYIEHVVRIRALPGKVEEKLLEIAEMDGSGVEISLPQDPGQAGKSQVSYLAKQLAGFTVHFSVESGDKETRAGPVSSQAEAGNVRMVRGIWNDKFIEEATLFPNSEFKDQIDALSRAFHRVLAKSKGKKLIAGPEEVPLESTT